MSKNTLVIYKSKTGFTERYAKWIAGELFCDMIPYGERKKICFDQYGTVVYGGAFYAGSINGIKWFKEKIPELNGKTLIVFVTGAMQENVPEIEESMKRNFTEEERQKVKLFYMQAGLCYEKMGITDKILMAGLKKMLKKSGENEMYKQIEKSFDCAEKEKINSLVQYCRDNMACVK